MRDENGNRANGKARDRANQLWSDWHKNHPGEKLPILEFLLTPKSFSAKPLRLERFELVSWTIPGGKGYGWVTGRRLEEGPGGPLSVSVTEIPPDLNPEDAIRETASPFPVHFMVMSKNESGTLIGQIE